MPIYRYEGINSLGKKVKAAIKADGTGEAKMKVKSLGVMISSIEEKKLIKVVLFNNHWPGKCFSS